jgi:hypothetical protein
VDRLPNDTAIAIQAPQDFQRDWLPDRVDWELRRYGGTHVAIGQTEKANGAANARVIPDDTSGE